VYLASVVVPEWLVLTTAVLLAMSLSTGIWKFVNVSMKGGTAAVVTNMQVEGDLPSKDKWEGLLDDINDIKNQFCKIEYLEHQNISLSAQINNGIKDRLDDIVEDQKLAAAHRNQIDGKLNTLIGMFNQQYN